MKKAFTMTGGPELIAALKELPEVVSAKLVRKVMLNQSTQIRDAARSLAPKRTGRLELFIGRSSGFGRNGEIFAHISVFQFASSDKRLASYGKIKRGGVKIGSTLTQDAYYGRFVELGTRHMSARPFLVPAFEEKAQDFIDGTTNDLADVISQWASKHRA